MTPDLPRRGGGQGRPPACSLVILAMMAMLAAAACLAGLIAALFPTLVSSFAA